MLHLELGDRRLAKPAEHRLIRLGDQLDQYKPDINYTISGLSSFLSAKAHGGACTEVSQVYLFMLYGNNTSTWLVFNSAALRIAVFCFITLLCYKKSKTKPDLYFPCKTQAKCTDFLVSLSARPYVQPTFLLWLTDLAIYGFRLQL